jgi:hypothetical protein
MSELKQRLTNLWQREATTSDASRPLPSQFSEQMLVTITKPMKISGTLLGPGRYAFRPLDSGAEGNFVQILNEDQTRLFATVSNLSANLN